MELETLKFLPWLPALGAVLCGLCCMSKSARKFAGPICVLSILGAFAMAVAAYGNVPAENPVVTAFTWIKINTFSVDFGYYIDGLTMLMLFVVTGIGALIALYATGYMKGDRGYARFFAYMALFIFAMTTLVMADNLVLLYLGWEGVGLCSYLLIGYYYDKPTAVAAAKKAFIVNRIGDLGFTLGIFLIWYAYGTVSLQGVFDKIAENGGSSFAWADLWIPFLLMLGAFGKSAQLPLHVWLPDAMAGPTPVSALVHAATMVTSGVYLIARMIPVFELSPYALMTVAIVGGVTALFAATIALCSNDLKGVFAYSTISQLGYMFLGVGVMSTVGGMFHLFTHAFFKALLFLTAGSVMHALAGQLDICTMSGLRRKMPWTCWLMFAGCLALAGAPFTSGFFSKDTILTDVMAKGMAGDPLYVVLAVVGLFTALLTAFYTFRLWFKVFMGPEQYEMGSDGHGHHHEPHEMPFWPMNLPLVVLALGAILAGVFWDGWVAQSIANSSAAGPVVEGHGPKGLLGMSLHSTMMFGSGLIAILGIAAAAYFHWFRRDVTEKIAQKCSGVVRVLENKYYIDELYDFVIVRPLRSMGTLFNAIDDYLFQRLCVELIGGGVPKLVGLILRPTQHGKLQGYGVGMAGGLVIIAVIVLYKLT